jgi:hypothetical protein
MCKTPGIHFPERMMDSVYDTEMGEKGGFCIHASSVRQPAMETLPERAQVGASCRGARDRS